MNYGMIAPGNHTDFNSLREAPRSVTTHYITEGHPQWGALFIYYIVLPDCSPYFRHEKTPTEKIRWEIFSEKLGQLVQLQGHAALLAGSIVLVQKTLDDSLVDSLNGSLVSDFGSSLVTGDQSSVVLLQGGLQLGLVSLVLLVSNLGRNDILLGGLNVGHCCISFLGIFIQLHIIASFAIKINPLFKFFSQENDQSADICAPVKITGSHAQLRRVYVKP